MNPTRLRHRSALRRIVATVAVAALGGAFLTPAPASAATGDDLTISVTYDGQPVPNITAQLLRYDRSSGEWRGEPNWDGSASAPTDADGVLTIQDGSLPDGEYATRYYSYGLPTVVAPYATDQLWNGSDYVYPFTTIAIEFTVTDGSASEQSLKVALHHNAGAITARAVDATSGQPLNNESNQLSLSSYSGYTESNGGQALGALGAYPEQEAAPSTLTQSHLSPGVYFRSEVENAIDGSGTSTTYLPLQTITAGTTTNAGDVRIVPTSAPWVSSSIHSSWVDTITGDAVVGKPLTAQRPSDAAGVTFTYQWFVPALDDEAVDRPIAGATSQTYVPTAADKGRRLSVDVVASAPGYRAETIQGHNATAPVKIGDPNTGSVTITGTAKVGNTVTARVSTDLADSKSYQWYIDGTAIPDAVGLAYVIRDSDAGKALSVAVTSSVPGHTDAVIRSASVAVEAADSSSPNPAPTPTPSSTRTPRPTPTPAPTSTSTSAPKTTTPATTGSRRGSSLAANPGTVSISGTAKFKKVLKAKVTTAARGTVAYQWYRNGRRIGGANGSSYRVGAADLGSKLSVAARSTAQGYADALLTSAPRNVPKDKASLKTKVAKTVSAKKSLPVYVRVSPGASGIQASAKVKVYYSAKKFKTVLARSGTTATVSLPKMKKGKHTITIVYPGTASYKAKTVKQKVTVTR